MPLPDPSAVTVDTQQLSTAAALADVFDVQRRAFSTDGFPTRALRVDRLRRMLGLLVSNEGRIADALMSDFGYRSRDQSFFVEVVTTAKPIKEAIKRVGRWMKASRRHIDLPFHLAGGRAEVRYQPLGVVGCISPWNFPFNLSFSPLASILAAGNRAMLKPSETTPASAALIAELASAAFDASEIAVVTGGADTARAFAGLPFDHLIYTGGERVAKEIVRSSAEHLVPLTLELGGKSPVIVGNTANLKLAADRIVFGKMLNAGQICLAPDYVLVPDHLLQTFVGALKAAIHRAAPPEAGGRDYVSIVNSAHAQRIRSYVAEARQAGAEIVSFDWMSQRASGSSANMVPLTLIVNPADTLAVMRDEIFGPVLPIRTYRAFDEAVQAVRAGPKPLALYYFGNDRREIETLLTRTQSGGVTINDVIMHYTMDDLPFGGVGASGMGAYHGYEGFKRFSHARAIYRQSPVDIGALLRPPYGQGFQRFARFLLKHG